MERLRVVVSGRVQGVWYRASTQQQARTLGLSGWVRNCSNGDVEWAAEGSRAALEALATWCASGPPMARVQSVERFWETATEEYEDFTIRY